MLAESGLAEVEWKATRQGFTIQGRYTGPSGVATFPPRVAEVRKFNRRPAPL